ncbi:hypothetical protein MSAN_00390400 [Mycena sanguinolenta]|uniref:Coiled-coil domain-containing protein 130 n=1 Tax=Mycena sanguinolenta TaxID=230812 RepID=A0A8H7DJW8_9AGAR|nr:hypothetical protein MSAN_00390400 [Mycena sanguinolenta]
MQGFNKYYPPDFFDNVEKHGSLNSYRGKHALGDRARKLDQGILITRFELPFNIWCGTCNNHVGMGVRYKRIRRIPATSWFPALVKKDEDWNPEENGGFAVHDTEAAAVPADPLASLEKTADAQKGLVKAQDRLESLQEVSEHYNADPFTLSSKIRKRFREEKKIEKAKKAADDSIKDRYALPESLSLIEDDEKAAEDAKTEWARGRRELEFRESNKRRKLAVEITTIPTSSKSHRPIFKRPTTANPVVSLRARVLENTARHSNPFGRPKS